MMMRCARMNEKQKRLETRSLKREQRSQRHRNRGYLFLVLAVVATVWHVCPTNSEAAEMTVSSRLVGEGRRLGTASTASPTPSPTKNEFVGAFGEKDYFTQDQKKNGAILLHIYCALVTFYGIAVLCDNYFEPALEKICEAFELKEDVAGATFMAAGGSAPELFTSIMGVFVTKSDVGIGTIVGSAVFNVLFVIAVCAWSAPNLELTWWPLVRDCSYYCMSIMVLVICVLDQSINGIEAAVLLSLYAIYVGIMKHNEQLKTQLTFVLQHQENFHAAKHSSRRSVVSFVETQAFNLFIYAVIVTNVVASIGFNEYRGATVINEVCGYIYIAEFAAKVYGYGFLGYWTDALNAFDGVLVFMVIIEIMVLNNASFLGSIRSLRIVRFFRLVRLLRVLRLYRMMATEKVDKATQTEERIFAADYEPENDQLVDYDGTSDASPAAPAPTAPAAVEPAKKNQVMPVNSTKATSEGEKMQEEDKGDKNGGNDDDEDDDDDDDDGPFDPFDLPDDMLGKIVTIVNLPVVLLMWLTIPDTGYDSKFLGLFPRYPFAFAGCIVWITILSYFMVWMATEFGITANIPPPVMGLTFLAAGTSIPDAMSSLAVARRGFGDMAVSSSIGSNIFDILIGLPVPWFTQTVLIDYGSTIRIESDGLAIMIITLFVMVALVITCIHLADWKLSRWLGHVFMGLYVLFVVESLCLEYNVF